VELRFIKKLSPYNEKIVSMTAAFERKKVTNELDREMGPFYFEKFVQSDRRWYLSY